jgi:hypothetical protein
LKEFDIVVLVVIASVSEDKIVYLIGEKRRVEVIEYLFDASYVLVNYYHR